MSHRFADYNDAAEALVADVREAALARDHDLIPDTPSRVHEPDPDAFDPEQAQALLEGLAGTYPDLDDQDRAWADDLAANIDDAIAQHHQEQAVAEAGELLQGLVDAGYSTERLFDLMDNYGLDLNEALGALNAEGPEPDPHDLDALTAHYFRQRRHDRGARA
jgi:gamma-glutamyl:cysteine ligase YbdK (ATP-grasp superfamily)